MQALSVRHAVGLVLTLVAAGIAGVGVEAQSLRPPIPEVAASDLRYPDPVGVGFLRVVEVLPAQLPLGFFLSLDQEALAGEWDVRGTVVEADKDRIIFNTEKEEEARLLYRLPGQRVLELKPGDPVSIGRTLHGHGVSMGYLIGIASNARLLASAGRVLGEEPQMVEVIDGQLRIKQTDERIAELGQSPTEVTYEIAAVLEAGGKTIPITMDEPVDVVVEQGRLRVVLLNSTEVLPDPKYEDVAEGSGFALEFAATPSAAEKR